MLTLYYAPNTCALASHIALEQAGADYRAVRVDFARNEQRSPEYLKLNPKGRVPALVSDRGVLTETPAILQYVAQTHPAAALAPLDDAFALAQLNAFNSYLCSTVHVAHAHMRRGYRWVDDEAAMAAMKQKVPQNMADCFALIERDHLQGPWVLGERYSIADPYLFTIAQWLAGDGVDIERFPKVAAHHRRMQADAAVMRVLAVAQAPA
ncbi:glutathione S-transferase family protein [Aquabacterium sp.]|uniref:glutathione S-transferase family protein n=1 Tax=Aquabacterium sp. TaxID=1872578 RepID=UPI003783D30E